VSIESSWPPVRLETLLTDIQPGFASGKHNSEGMGIPHLRPMNVSTDGKIQRSVLKFVEPGLAARPTRRLQRGDVLFNNTNSPELVGKTALFDDDDEPAFSNHMTRLRVDPARLDAGFLALRLHHAWREGWFATRCNNHVSQASIGREVLQTFQFELPPLDVQRAIYMFIRSADGRVTSCRGHLTAASRATERIRSAALAAAYSDALDESGGSVVPLERLLREPLKNGYSAIPVNHVTPFRVLTLTATTSGWFNDQHFKFTDEEFSAQSPFWLCPGDILIQRGNTPEYVGVPALYEGTAREFLYPDLMIRARVREDIAPRFVWYMLLAPQARAYVRERATGSAGNMPKVNQKILNQVPVPLPTGESRQRIVEKLDRVLALVSATNLNLNKGKRAVDRSLQAVLAKALRGELVTSKCEA
jgi:type I restriction enzyme S subunit